MCGRFTLADISIDAIRDRFLLDDIPEELLQPRYNIAPTQNVPLVRESAETHRRELALLRWGLVPRWADDIAIGSRMINARAEGIESKPAFRDAFRSRRGLIVSDGFFEWKSDGKVKQPYYIQVGGGDVFAIAALWEKRVRDGQPLETCTIVTTQANELVSEYHDRMPVIIEPKDFEFWLSPEVKETPALAMLLRSYPAEQMSAVPVSRVVNNAKIDSPDCIAPPDETAPQLLQP